MSRSYYHMKKLKYESEDISVNWIAVFFSSIPCIAICIGACLYGISDINIVSILMCAPFFIFFIINIVFLLEKKSTINKNNMIKKNGQRVVGNIFKYDIKKEQHYINHEIQYKHIFKVYVGYTDPYTKKHQTFETPPLNFNPLQLSSKKCSVYVYDNMVYVTDFQQVKKDEKNVWFRDNHKLEKKLTNEQLKADESNKLELKKVKIFCIIWILAVLSLIIYFVLLYNLS